MVGTRRGGRGGYVGPTGGWRSTTAHGLKLCLVSVQNRRPLRGVEGRRPPEPAACGSIFGDDPSRLLDCVRAVFPPCSMGEKKAWPVVRTRATRRLASLPLRALIVTEGATLCDFLYSPPPPLSLSLTHTPGYNFPKHTYCLMK